MTDSTSTRRIRKMKRRAGVKRFLRAFWKPYCWAFGHRWAHVRKTSMEYCERCLSDLRDVDAPEYGAIW